MRQLPLMRICICFVFGIVIQGQIQLNIHAILLLCIGFFILVGICYFISKKIIGSIQYFGWTSAFFFTLLGMLILQLNDVEIANNYYGHYVKDYARYHGTIESKKETKNSFQYVVEISAIQTDEFISGLQGKMIFYEPSKPIQVGDEVVFRASPNRIPESRNTYAFDYASYMFHRGVLFQAFVQDVEVLYSKSSRLTQFRNQYVLAIKNTQINDLSKSVILAMIAGDKSELGNITDVFRMTGASHVLAISGLHVGIIALLVNFIMGLLFPYKRRMKSVFLICAVWIFCLLSGSFPSTIRACTMVTAYSISMMVNRQAYALNSCFFAAFLMLLINPNQIHDIGFQFSFLALFGILIYFNPISKIFTFQGIREKIWQMSVLSFAAQILILPLSLYYFHSFPVYFLPASLIAVPVTFFIVCVGIFDVMLSYVIGDFQLINLAIDYTVHYFIAFLRWVSEWPYATIDNLWPSKSELFSYYGLVMLISFLTLKSKKNYGPFIIIAFLALLCFNLFNKIERNKTQLVVYQHRHEVLFEVIHQGQVYQYFEKGIRMEKRLFETEATHSFFQAEISRQIELNNDQNFTIEIGPESLMVWNVEQVVDWNKIDYLLINQLPVNIDIPERIKVFDYRKKKVNQNSFTEVNKQLIKTIN